MFNIQKLTSASMRFGAASASWVTEPSSPRECGTTDVFMSIFVAELPTYIFNYFNWLSKTLECMDLFF